MTVHLPPSDSGQATALLRVPAASIRFNAAYACATEIQYFVDQVRAALDRANDPRMALVAVERAELAWSAHGAELRRRLRTRMSPDQRRAFDQVDNLLDATDALSPNPAFARYFAVLWLGSAVSARIAMAKLHGPDQFRSAIESALRSLRDYVERRWMSAQVAFLEQYPWIDRDDVVVRVEGLGSEAGEPMVVVERLDTLP